MPAAYEQLDQSNPLLKWPLSAKFKTRSNKKYSAYCSYTIPGLPASLISTKSKVTFGGQSGSFQRFVATLRQ